MKQPKRGEIYFLDFSPSKGREIKGSHACTLPAPQRGRQGHAQTGGVKQSFPHKQTSHPDKKKWDCENLPKKEVFAQ